MSKYIINDTWFWEGINLSLDGIGKKNFKSHVYVSGAIIKCEMES